MLHYDPEEDIEGAPVGEGDLGGDVMSSQFNGNNVKSKQLNTKKDLERYLYKER